MSSSVDYTPRFLRRARKLGRKRRTLQEQIKQLAADLQAGDRPGDRLQGVGAAVYKTRLASPDTKEGKRGSFRVAYLVHQDGILMLAICKKPKCSDVEPEAIRRILKAQGFAT